MSQTSKYIFLCFFYEPFEIHTYTWHLRSVTSQFIDARFPPRVYISPIYLSFPLLYFSGIDLGLWKRFGEFVWRATVDNEKKEEFFPVNFHSYKGNSFVLLISRFLGDIKFPLKNQISHSVYVSVEKRSRSNSDSSICWMAKRRGDASKYRSIA